MSTTPMEMEGGCAADLAAATAHKEEGAAQYKRADYKGAIASYTGGLAKLGDSEAKLRALQGEELAL
jgi:hypothetical protein